MRRAAFSCPLLAMLLIAASFVCAQQAATVPSPPPPTEFVGKTLLQYVKEARDGDPSVKIRAIQAITAFGDTARKEAAPTIIDCIADADASVRIYAALALTGLGVEPRDMKKAVGVLHQRVSGDKQAVVRYHCANTLGRLGRDAREALPGLLRAVQDLESCEIRRAAVFAVGQVAAPDEKIPVDMKAASIIGTVLAGGTSTRADTSAEVRQHAAVVLASWGPPQNPADRATLIGKLQHAVTKDKDKGVQIWARVALILYGGTSSEEEHLAAIVRYLEQSEPVNARAHAAQALGALGLRARARIPDLIKALKDKEPSVVATAVVSLGSMGEAASRALPTLEALYDAKETDESVKQVIKDVIPRIAAKK